MGPLDRFVFRAFVSLALHVTVAVVAGVAAALLAEQQLVVAGGLAALAAANVLLGLRLHLRLLYHLQGQPSS